MSGPPALFLFTKSLSTGENIDRHTQLVGNSLYRVRFSLAICHEAQYCCEVPGELVPCVPSIQKVLSFLHPFPCCKPGIHSPTAPQPNSRPYRPLSYNACPTCHLLCSSVLSSGAGGATPTRGIEGKSCDTYLNLL